MKNQSVPQGFHAFYWALGVFCLPIFLCPLALLISQNFSRNPNLTKLQEGLLYGFFWGYPVLLVIIARIAFKLHIQYPKAAYWLLLIASIIFYAALILSINIGLN